MGIGGDFGTQVAFLARVSYGQSCPERGDPLEVATGVNVTVLNLGASNRWSSLSSRLNEKKRTRQRRLDRTHPYTIQCQH